MAGYGDGKHISIAKLREILADLPADWLIFPKTVGDTGDLALLQPPATQPEHYVGYINLSEEIARLWEPATQESG
jgi:hypothetical protein